MPSTPAGSSRPTRTTSVSTGRSSPGNFETKGGLGGSAPTPPTRHRQRASSTASVNPGGLRNKERPKVSATTIRTLLVAVLALAAVVGSLYYVGRGAQSKGESPEQLPRSEQQQVANGPQQRADQPAAEEGPRGVPRETLRAEEPATSPPAATARDAHRTGQRRRRPRPAEHPRRWRALLRTDRRARFLPDLPGAARISIKTGNAGAVGVVVNGQDLGRLGDSGEVSPATFSKDCDLRSPR